MWERTKLRVGTSQDTRDLEMREADADNPDEELIKYGLEEDIWYILPSLFLSLGSFMFS